MKKLILTITITLGLGTLIKDRPQQVSHIGMANYDTCQEEKHSLNFSNLSSLPYNPNDKVTIFGVGGVSREKLIQAEQIINKFFRHKTIIVESDNDSEYNYYIDKNKTLLDAEKFVRDINDDVNDGHKVLIITNKNMYALGTNCRGFSLLGGRTLLVGDGWFMQETIIHEMGHVYGLTHCNDLTCIMAIYNDEYDSGTFCKKCKQTINYY